MQQDAVRYACNREYKMLVTYGNALEELWHRVTKYTRGTRAMMHSVIPFDTKYTL